MTHEQAAVQAALRALEDSRTEQVRTLIDLVRIPSVVGTPAEIDIVHHVAGLLAGLEIDCWSIPVEDLAARPEFPGMEVERSVAWGLVARLPGREAAGRGRSLMFNGHLDVVPPGDRATWSADPFSGLLRDGAVFGRGACDMKGGVVAAMYAMLALHRAGVRPAGDVLFAAVIGEEDGGLGTYATLDRGWRADACVITEPTGLDLLVANGGALTFRLRVPGRAAHASVRTSGVSAVEKFQPVFAALRSLEARRNARVDPVMRRWDIAYPLEIGAVRSGDWSSTVPDLLVAEGRFGVMLDEPVAEAKRDFERAVAEASAADPWLASHPVDVEWWGGQFASGRCLDGDLIDHVRVATRAEPAVAGAPYGSDLRLLAAAGIPTLQYGPGHARHAHAPDERVPVEQVHRCAETLVRLAFDWCA